MKVIENETVSHNCLNNLSGASKFTQNYHDKVINLVEIMKSQFTNNRIHFNLSYINSMKCIKIQVNCYSHN